MQIPPRYIDNVPDAALEAFKADIPLPEPTKSAADKALDVLFRVKFAYCKIDGAEFPINN